MKNLKITLAGKINNLEELGRVFITKEEVKLLSSDDFFINLCQEKQVVFGVEESDIKEMDHNNNGETSFEEQLRIDGCLMGFPVVEIEGDDIVVESCFGWGSEDRVVCKRVFMEIL